MTIQQRNWSWAGLPVDRNSPVYWRFFFNRSCAKIKVEVTDGIVGCVQSFAESNEIFNFTLDESVSTTWLKCKKIVKVKLPANKRIDIWHDKKRKMVLLTVSLYNRIFYVFTFYINISVTFTRTKPITKRPVPYELIKFPKFLIYPWIF